MTICSFPDCGTIATYNVKGMKKATFCKKHREPAMIDVHNRNRCEFESCSKRSTFNFPDTKKTIFCSEHRLPGMINLINRLCQEDGCPKHPCYGEKGSNKKLYCTKHKKENMVDIRKKICTFENCNKRAIYKKIGLSLTTPEFCHIHKQPGTILTNKKKICEFIGCSYKPSFNFINQKHSKYCSIHKEPGMVNINHKLCEFEGCETIPFFNIQGSTKGKYCSIHKKQDMVDVLNKKLSCEYKDCNKYPCCNIKGEKQARFCNEHKIDGMIDVIHKKCSEQSCEKRPTYGFPGYSVITCFSHKKVGMIRRSGKKICVGSNTENCNELAIYGISEPIHCEKHVVEKEYNLLERECSQCKRIDILNPSGICVNFCSLENSDRVVKKLVKRKEETINSLLDKEINIAPFSLDESPDRSCTLNKPDRVYNLGSHIVIVEIDEHQHKSYKCTAYGDTKEGRMKGERIRMYQIAQSYPEFPPCIFIRYNPDNYRDNKGALVKNGNFRHELLVKWVKHCINWEDIEGLKVKYLFYDGFDESDSSFEDLQKEDVL